MSNKYQTQLMSICSEYDIELKPDTASQLCKFLELVLEKNKVLNLTAIRDYEKGIVLHLLDSLLYLRFFDHDTSRKFSFFDIGTGAGFPGIPIALCCANATGTLCDSVKKKIAAVREFLDSLDLTERVSVTDQRVEEFARTNKHTCDYVVARAVAPLSALIEYAAPLMKNNAKLVISKGVPEPNEMTAGERAAHICGLQLDQKEPFELPDDYGCRTFFVYTKKNTPKIALPRQVGMALKHPLS